MEKHTDSKIVSKEINEMMGKFTRMDTASIKSKEGILLTERIDILVF